MFKNYIKTAWRNLVKNRVIAALNITGLAIGVVVCLLIGVWLKNELSFDRFHPQKERIFRVSNTFKSESESFSQAPSGPALGAQLPSQLPIISSSCRLFDNEHRFKVGNHQFMESQALMVDSNFFSFFGFKLKKGDPKKALLSLENIVITEDLAVKYFGKEDPMGKTMQIDGNELVTVSGVAENPPVNSQIQFDLLQPAAVLVKKAKEQWNFDMNNMWVGGWPMTFVKLAENADPKVAEKQINEVVARFSAKDWKENKMSYYYFLQPLTDIHLKSNLRYDASNNGSISRVKVFSIIGIIVLLLACINYVNLTTAGAIKRAKETSVRKVMGAPKAQLIRQFFMETFVVCALAVGLGVLLLQMVLPWFSQWIGQTYTFPITPVNALILFILIASVSLIAGLYPAAILSSFNPAVSLKGNFSQSKKGNVIRKTLVVFQFTITIGLVAAIMIINRQMNYIRNKSLGFDGSAVVEVRFQGDTSVLNHYAFLRNKLLGSPYIMNVSKHGQNVVGGLGNGWTTTENLKGEEISTSLYQMSADTSYFNVYNMKLAAGRFFSSQIPTDTTSAVLINEAAVRTFGWQNAGNAIGKRFGKAKDAKYVIGVVKDFNFENLHKPVEALMIHYTKDGSRLSLKIDARHVSEAIGHLEQTWKAEVPEIPLQFSFVDESISKQYGNEQKMQTIFYAFAGLSLLIACFGLFGLSIFVVERKIKEIGIRKVLGASVPDIVSLLSANFIKLVLISFLIASPLAWYFMNNWLEDFAYRISINVWVFILSGVGAVLIALITVSFQAIRAAVANPVKNLRTE